MRLKKKYLLNLAVLLITFFPHCSIMAQDVEPSWDIPGADATFATTEFLDLLLENYDDEAGIKFLMGWSDANTVLRINVHVIKDAEGNVGVAEQDVSNAIQDANTTFDQIGINFNFGVLNLIPEYAYGGPIDSVDQEELFNRYLIDSTINLFLLDSVNIGNRNFYGYTYFPEGEYDAIYLCKEYLSGNALIAQLGHFFGLLSTHDTLAGEELVDGSNCHEAGDLICDTWADPSIYLKVNDDCEFFGSVRDANDEWFAPSVANYMADGPSACKCVFSELQYRRIFYYYKHYRSYLK